MNVVTVTTVPTRYRRSVATIVVSAAALLAACSSSTPAMPSASASKADIAHAYQTLFNMQDKAVGTKLAVIQNGSTLKNAITAALASPMAGEAAGATVNSVSILSDSGCKAEYLPSPCAAVGYSILLPSVSTGNLTGLKGFAVYENGRWVVSRSTICSLLTLENNNNAPQGC